MLIVPIEDPEDRRAADFVGLSDPDLRRMRAGSDGTEGGFFIAEGMFVIRELLRSDYRVRSLLLTPGRLATLEPELGGLDVPVYLASPAVMRSISGFNLHRGALASADRRPQPDLKTLAAGAALLVATEGVNDHENLGALFRNAAAFGAGGVLLDRTSADPLYRRSVRVSMGQVLQVPFTRAPEWPAALDELRRLDFEVLALTPSHEGEDLRGVERQPRQVLMVGAEGPGLSRAALASADRRVRIDIARGVDSLNVATAVAVALHHLAGQKTARGPELRNY